MCCVSPIRTLGQCEVPYLNVSSTIRTESDFTGTFVYVLFPAHREAQDATLSLLPMYVASVAKKMGE